MDHSRSHTDIQALAKQAGAQLLSQQRLLATAESCTGGGLSYFITDIAGSSNWFDRGFITYSNQAKQDMLGVSPQTLQTHGAVSEQSAYEMATGALKHSNADISIAITGIAGPTGGTINKPIGTIWLAWATKNGSVQTECHHFTGDRETVRLKTIYTALQQLIVILN